MAQAGQIAETTSSGITQSLAQTAAGMDNMGGSALSASQKMFQMRSGLSAVRDGAMGAFVGGQRADMMFMAMGHHFSTLVATTGSLGGAFTALGASLAGAGGVILALTLAFEVYQRSVGNSKQTTDEYIQSLNDVTQARIKGEVAGVTETTRLQILYKATQDHTLSLTQRNAAYNELERLFPKIFSDAQREITLNGDNKKSYDDLTKSILAAAQAKSAEEQIGELSKQKFVDQQKIDVNNQKKYDADLNAAKQYIAEKKALLDPNSAASQTPNIGTPAESFIHMTAQAKHDADQANIDALSDQKDAQSQIDKLLKVASTNETAANFQTKPGGGKNVTDDVASQFEILTQKSADLKLALENALLANDKPTVIDALSIKLVTVQQQLEKIKTQLDADMTIGGLQGLPQLSAVSAGASGDPADGTQQTKDALQGAGIVARPDTDVKKNVTEMMAFTAAYKLNTQAAIASQTEQSQWDTQAKQDVKTVTLLTDTIGKGLTKAFEDALSGTKSFLASFGDFIKQLIEKIVAAAAAAAILAALLSATGFGGTAGSSFGSIFGKLSGLGGLIGGGGSATGAGFSMASFATGGIFTQPTSGIFGEAGPEAIVTPQHLADFANVSASGGSDFKVTHIISGADLQLLITRSAKQKGRLS